MTASYSPLSPFIHCAMYFPFKVTSYMLPVLRYAGTHPRPNVTHILIETFVVFSVSPGKCRVILSYHSRMSTSKSVSTHHSLIPSHSTQCNMYIHFTAFNAVLFLWDVGKANDTLDHVTQTQIHLELLLQTPDIKVHQHSQRCIV